MTVGAASIEHRVNAHRARRVALAPTLRFVLTSSFWLVMAVGTGLIVYNSLPYFTLSREIDFLVEKGRLWDQAAWRVCFYLHVGGGVICLVSALTQFSRVILRRVTTVHRHAGRIYGAAVLLLVAPAGAYLSVYAKGGFWGRSGFALLAVSLFYTTWLGVREASNRNYRAHARWMIRSYVMAASAVSFRVFYLALYALGIPNEYVLGIWLSWSVNLAAGEAVIHLSTKGRTS